MKAYKQIIDRKGISFFVLTSFFILFLILSFFSLNNVYGLDSETIVSSDIDTDNVGALLVNDLNQNNLSMEDNSDFYNESIQNTSNTTDNSQKTKDTTMNSSKLFLIVAVFRLLVNLKVQLQIWYVLILIQIINHIIFLMVMTLMVSMKVIIFII